MNLEKDNGFYTYQEYTVEQCHALCIRRADCGGFFIPNTDIRKGMNKGSCLLYKKGCENNGDVRFDHYTMADCKNLHLGNSSFCDLN